jgi:AraC-like DNA-binding protein
MTAMPMPFSTIVRPSYRRGRVVPAHNHAFPQLLCASSGVMRVETTMGASIVPPQWALWLPPECVHEAHMLTDVQLSSLYVKQPKEWTNRDFAFIEVSPLLRELIDNLAMEPDTHFSRRNGLIAQLIVEELTAAQTAGRPIPMPQDPRLRALCQKVLNEASAHATLDDLANNAGLSAKTAARLFERELGMSFRRWREMVHVANAVAHFAQGKPVKVVASLLGYTPSAFSVMMRRHSGTTPMALKCTLNADVAATPPAE